MLQLSDYENINLNKTFDFKINKAAVESILGILLFPVVNEEMNERSFKIIGSEIEKSFWSSKTKEKGCIKFEYLKTIEDDISNIVYHGYGEPNSLPEYSNILLAFEFESDYSKYHSFEKHCIQGHEMGKSRKEVLSYGILNDIIQEDVKAWSDLLKDYLKSGGQMLTSEFSIMHDNSMSRGQIRNNFKVFDKYKIATKIDER